MNELKEIQQFIVARGFEKIPSYSYGKRDLWYKKSNLEHGTSVFLFLEFKPSAKAYSVHVGITDELAHACLAEVSDSVDNFLDPLMRQSDFVHRPCWCFFDAGRALGWSSGFVVPDPAARGQWLSLMGQLFNEFVDPIFLSIKHKDALIALLLRNDAPFEWAFSPAVLRASEVIALYTLLGTSAEEIYNKIDVYTRFIQKQISENYSIPVFVDKLILEIRECSYSKIRGDRLPSSN